MSDTPVVTESTAASVARQITIEDPRHQFYWWGRATGKVPGGPIMLQGDAPESGYYRGQSKDKQTGVSTSYAALFYYTGRLRQEGVLLSKRNGRDWDEDKARYAWPFVSKRPVSKEDYETFIATGTWPGESALVTASLSNEAPDENTPEGVEAQINALAAEVKKLLEKGAAKTKDEADNAADVATRLGSLYTKADELRKVEKRPHYEETLRVDDKWRPILSAAAIYSRIKGEVLKPWLDAENLRLKRVHEEAQIAHAAAVAAAAMEAAKTPAGEGEEGEGGGAAPAPEPVIPAAPILQTAKAGSRGRSISSRSETSGKINDLQAALAWVSKTYPDALLAFVQEKVTMAAKAGITADGCEIVKSGKAV